MTLQQDPFLNLVEREPWKLILLGLLVLGSVALWRHGTTFGKWFVGLLIAGVLAARWNNTIWPWLTEGK